MNKVIKLGIVYNEGEGPDFGTIQQHWLNPNNLYLLARDIPKLNGMLTRATSAAYLPEGQSFNFYTGALAYVVDYKTAGSGKIYMYHRGKDHWYEFNIRSDLGLCELMWNRHETILRKTKTISGTPPLTFESNGRPLKNYRIYGNTVNGESVGDLVTEGEHAGEYCVPVTISNGSNTQTTNIYIPEQIRKIGDELEYIDYEKQKLYRIRKNLFNKNSNKVSGYISDNGTILISNSVVINTFDYITVTAQQLYSFKAFSSTTQSVYQRTVRVAYYDENKNYLSRSVYVGEGLEGFSFETPENCQYIQLSIDDNLCNNMLVKGNSIPIEYESFIEDIELDVTLPALPISEGTNILSVTTQIQPLKIEIKGRCNY